jgi:AcrR family transcriptional regulator
MSPVLALRSVIHRSAVFELATHGYHGADLAGIADRAGVEERDVLALAEDLDQLFADAIVTGYEEWRSRRADWMPIAAGESLRAHLRATLLGQARGLSDPPPLVVAGIALLMEDLPEDLPARVVCLEHRQQAQSEMTAWLRYAIDRDPAMPQSRPETARVCAEIIIAAFEGFVIASVVGDAPDPVGFAEVLIGLVMNALGG